VSPEPAFPDPGRDQDPAPRCGEPDDLLRDEAADRRLIPPVPNWMDEGQWAAFRASLAEEEEPPDPDL
jgi:hypothetical protein